MVERPAVAAGADWYVHSYDQLVSALKRYKVCAVCVVCVWVCVVWTGFCRLLLGGV